MTRNNLFLEIGSGSDVGCVRSQNEDSFLVKKPGSRKHHVQRGFLLAVCDGMGGALGGQTASTIAAEEIGKAYYEWKTTSPTDALVFAIQEANYRIYERALKDPNLHGMGTTVVAAAILGKHVSIAHVGDSRCYLTRKGTLRQITEDHKLVNKLVKEGLLTKDEAANHPESHILSRPVGVAAEVEIEARKALKIEDGDKVLLCSDGLTGVVGD